MTELTDIHRDENGSQADTIAPPALKRAWSAGRAAFGSGWRPSRVALAPGRLELLGNHIDYNGGPLLAAAIDRFVVVAGWGGGNAGSVPCGHYGVLGEPAVPRSSRKQSQRLDYEQNMLQARHSFC